MTILGRVMSAVSVIAPLVGLSVSTLSAEPPNVSSPLELKVKDINGKEADLAAYKGKVVMIVNVASKCGLTPQYAGLESLYEKYKDRGFVILGFPENNFLGQEPGSDPEIKLFCTTKYNVSFPMFSKISVKGEDIAPLYAWLTSKKTDPGFDGDIEWNFGKFLLNHEGKVVNRFHPKVKPDAAEVVSAVEKALEAREKAMKPHK
jgi:glutathione peroxidase